METVQGRAGHGAIHFQCRREISRRRPDRDWTDNGARMGSVDRHRNSRMGSHAQSLESRARRRWIERRRRRGGWVRDSPDCPRQRCGRLDSDSSVILRNRRAQGFARPDLDRTASRRYLARTRRGRRAGPIRARRGGGTRRCRRLHARRSLHGADAGASLSRRSSAPARPAANRLHGSGAVIPSGHRRRLRGRGSQLREAAGVDRPQGGAKSSRRARRRPHR